MRMYNRYIPQPDGTYQKNRLPEQLPHEKPQKPPEAPPPQHCPMPDKPPPLKPHPHRRGRIPQKQPQHPETISGFFRQLLPKDMDTGDLLVILLLLLMAGDSEEHKNNALLTLALYFFM